MEQLSEKAKGERVAVLGLLLSLYEQKPAEAALSIAKKIGCAYSFTDSEWKGHADTAAAWGRQGKGILDWAALKCGFLTEDQLVVMDSIREKVFSTYRGYYRLNERFPGQYSRRAQPCIGDTNA